MESNTAQSKQKINMEVWERSAEFQFFRNFDEPYHGVCLRVDCTGIFDHAKQRGLSVFLSLMHRALVAAHKVENFRLRINGDEVWRFERIDGGSAVGRPNGTIGFGHYPFLVELEDFVRDSSRELDRVRRRTDIERYPEANLIRFSVLPWLDFTSISHARDLSREDSAPRITFGKITESNGRYTMPISIHVHHGLVDGSHVAAFVEQLETCFASPHLQP